MTPAAGSLVSRQRAALAVVVEQGEDPLMAAGNPQIATPGAAR